MGLPVDDIHIEAELDFCLSPANHTFEQSDNRVLMLGLAVTLNALDAHEAAQELELKVLKVRQRDLGDDHPATLEAMGNLGSTINNIAVALRNDGNLEDAEPLQFEALAMVVKAFGADDLVTACV